MSKATLQLQLQGFSAANRDAEIELVHESTGRVYKRKPFLDGKLLLRNLEPGFYDMKVVHPNLTFPIDRRRIRAFPQKTPTRITIPVPEDLFVDTPIRDIPDADLAPVQQVADAVSESLIPIAEKSPGEVIKASDWVTLVKAVSDLSGAVLHMTNLIAVRGHNHPELEEKINEVQENIRRFGEAYGQSLLELRREIEMQSVRRQMEETLDQAGVSATDPVRVRFQDRLRDLEDAVQTNTAVFTNKLSQFGSLVQTELPILANNQGDQASEFLNHPAVVKLAAASDQYARTGIQIQPEAELKTYRRTTTATGGRKLGDLLNVNRLLG